MTVDLRPAVITDSAGIAEIIEQVWGDSGGVSRIAAMLESGGHDTRIAICDGRIAGFVDSFSTRSAEGAFRWEVDLLAMHPDFRGRGLARSLVAATTDVARRGRLALARGLVKAGNAPAEHSFAASGYVCDETVCALYVSTSANEEGHFAAEGAHLIPVRTFTYSGVWLEGEISPATIAAARKKKEHLGLDIVGAVISIENVAGIEAMGAAGFDLVDHYRWWILDLRKA